MGGAPLTARRGLAALLVAGLTAVGCSAGAGGEADTAETSGSTSSTAPPVTVTTVPLPPPEYTLEPYRGLGTWVDVFDFSPRFAGDRGPQVSPADLDAMADAGVETIYLQAARDEQDIPGGIPDPGIVGAFLEGAHERGMAVVAWYLPRRFDDDDLSRLQALANFRAGPGRDQAFDGLAVDIEWRKGVPELEERNRALVEFSTRVREVMGDAVIGAIVLPPVLLEVVNEKYWASFPWRGIAPLYDVWLPMSYWTDRQWASGYQDPYVYTDETVRRMRNNLGLPDAVTHVIGGIGDKVAPGDHAGLGRAVVEHGAVGVSLYDWASLPEDQRPRLREALG